MPDLVSEAQDMFKRFKEQFIHTHSTLLEIEGPAKARSLSAEDMVDIAFFCRETRKLADDLRKEAKAREELLGKLIALHCMEEMEPRVHGTHATGTPDSGLKPKLPRPGTTEYERLCDYMGVTREQMASGLVRFHWPTLQTMMQNAAAEGRDFPVTIESTPEFRTTLRRKGTKADEQN